MDTYRLLIVVEDLGDNEDVYFLDKDNKDVGAAYCAPGQKVAYDEKIEADLPMSFPIESQLRNIR